MSNFLQTALTVGALAIGATAFAANYSCAPSQGKINLEDCPGGVNSVEILGSFSINRTAEGFITLYQNDEIIRQVPASNLSDIYTFEGFDKTDVGNVHVTFFNVNGPAKDNGLYKVTVPAGFFTVASTGLPTEDMQFEWQIESDALKITPAAGGHYTSLKEFKIELPKVITQGIKSEAVESYAVHPDSVPVLSVLVDPDINYPASVSIDGNIATLTLNEAVTTPETYSLYVPAYLFTYTTVSGKKITSKENNFSYYVDPDSKGAMTILPAEGSYEEFAANTCVAATGKETSYTFMLVFPEDAPMTMPLKGQVKLCPLNEDGTYDTSASVASFQAVKVSGTELALSAITGADKPVSVAPGKYALVIPANLYMTAQGRNGAYYFVYEVLPNTNFPFTIEPADGSLVQNISEVTLTFAEGMEVATSAKAYATLSNGIATYTMSGTVDPEKSNVIVYSLPVEMAIAGNWTFRTPTNLTVDGFSFSTSATYTVENDTFVNTVVYPEGDVTLYNLTGVKVAEGQLKTVTLPAGIYVAVDAEGNAVKVRF